MSLALNMNKARRTLDSDPRHAAYLILISCNERNADAPSDHLRGTIKGLLASDIEVQQMSFTTISDLNYLTPA